jgi:plasmid stability protein
LRDISDSIAIMASITVRNLDDEVKARLRRRAAESGHSMEEEVRKVLSYSVGVGIEGRPRSGADLYRRIRARFYPLDGAELEIPPRGPARKPPEFE